MINILKLWLLALLVAVIPSASRAAYPSQIDNFSTSLSLSKVANAALAIENTLGTNPQGTSSTVGTRLSIIESLRDWLEVQNIRLSVDEAFPSQGSYSLSVSAIHQLGDTLYVGGQFGVWAGVTRNCLVAIDVPTKTVINTFDAAITGTSGVTVMVNKIIDSPNAGNLIVVGRFTTVSGTSRIGVAEIDAATGIATSFDANLLTSTSSASVVAAVVRGSNIYFGGTGFSSVGGVTLTSNLAAVDNTGVLQPFYPKDASPSGPFINDLESTPLGIWAFGSFSYLSPTPSARIAVLDATTGNNLGFIYNESTAGLSSASNSVDSDGNFVYVVGGGNTALNFSGLPRLSGLMRFDGNTGAVDVTNTAMVGLAAEASAFVVVGGNKLYVSTGSAAGGTTVLGFGKQNGIKGTRRGVAVFDKSTMNLLPEIVDLDFNNTFRIYVTATKLYVGGAFGLANGVFRPTLASFSLIP